MGNRPVLTRTRQPAGAAGAHLCAPPAPTQQHTGVWDTCRNTSPANLCHEPLLRSAQRPSEKGASTARTICEHSRRNAHGRVTTLAVQHEVVTPSPATASDGGTGWARCDVECLVQTWLSRKSAPTGSPLQEHDVGVGRGEPSGVARIPAPAGKVRKSDIFGNL